MLEFLMRSALRFIFVSYVNENLDYSDISSIRSKIYSSKKFQTTQPNIIIQKPKL